MSKRRSEASQDVLLLTEVGDIAGFTLETVPGYAASFDTIEAWEIDLNQQAKDERSGNLIQVISERSKKPLIIFKDRPTLQGPSTNALASRKQDEAIAYFNNQREKNKLVTWVGIIAALFAVVISLVVLLRLREAGLLSVGFVNVVAAIQGLKQKKVESVSTDSEVSSLHIKEVENKYCIIIVEKTGLLVRRMLSSELIPGDSLERKFKGQASHILGLDTEDKLWAIEPPNKVELNDSPQDCYIPLTMYERLVSKIWRVGNDTIEKIKVGILVTLCIVELIILFLIITQVTGG